MLLLPMHSALVSTYKVQVEAFEVRLGRSGSNYMWECGNDASGSLWAISTEAKDAVEVELKVEARRESG